MINRLLSKQIPHFWEAIKTAGVMTDAIEEENRPRYFVELLHKLLNDRAQCFIRRDINGRVTLILLTEKMFNSVTLKSHISIEAVYAFAQTPETEWAEVFENVRKFAKNVGCDSVHGRSTNQKAIDICMANGFKKSGTMVRLEA